MPQVGQQAPENTAAPSGPAAHVKALLTRLGASLWALVRLVAKACWRLVGIYSSIIFSLQTWFVLGLLSWVRFGTRVDVPPNLEFAADFVFFMFPFGLLATHMRSNSDYTKKVEKQNQELREDKQKLYDLLEKNRQVYLSLWRGRVS